MDSKVFLENLKRGYNPEKMKGVTATYQFYFKEEEEETGLYVVMEDGEASFYEGETTDPNTTVSMRWDDFKKVLSKDLNVTTAFLTGKIKIKGNMSLAMKLQGLLG